MFFHSDCLRFYNNIVNSIYNVTVALINLVITFNSATTLYRKYTCTKNAEPA